MSTPDRVLSPDYDLFERRSKKRTTINHGAALFFAGHAGVYSCCGCVLRPDGREALQRLMAEVQFRHADFSAILV
jgi:hypothetical protein